MALRLLAFALLTATAFAASAQLQPAVAQDTLRAVPIQSLTARQIASRFADLDRMYQTMRGSGRAIAPATWKEITALRASIKSALDATGSTGEMESLLLQEQVERLSTLVQSLSKIMKKYEDSSKNTVQSLR